MKATWSSVLPRALPVMVNDIVWIYRRILPFMWGVPLLTAVPFAAELLQHLADVGLGSPKTGGLASLGRGLSMGFGLAKLMSIVAIFVVALRWWRYDGDARRALRPGVATATGILVFVLLAIAASSFEDGLTNLVAYLAGVRSLPLLVGFSIRFAVRTGWVYFSGWWLAWNVALLLDDPQMTLQRSIAAARGQLGFYFGLMCAGILPLLMLRYVLGNYAAGASGPPLWVLSIADAVVMVLLAVATASSFYAVYDAAKARG